MRFLGGVTFGLSHILDMWYSDVPFEVAMRPGAPGALREEGDRGNPEPLRGVSTIRSYRMKNRSPRRQSGRTDQLKETIRSHYKRLQAEWVAELDAVKSD